MKSNPEKPPPMRPWLLIDICDPIDMKSITEASLPTRTPRATETEEPQRAKQRTLIMLPMCTKLNVEILAPSRPWHLSEIAEEIVTKSKHERPVDITLFLFL
jgi:hypothetical protein